MKMALNYMHMELVEMISQQQSYMFTILQDQDAFKEKMMMIISHQMSFIDSFVLMLSSSSEMCRSRALFLIRIFTS